jgi:ABC-type ATPase involved in cell division
MELLDELMLRAPGVTVLAATHRHDHLDAWAEGTVVIERGRLLGVSVAEVAEVVR